MEPTLVLGTMHGRSNGKSSGGNERFKTVWPIRPQGGRKGRVKNNPG